MPYVINFHDVYLLIIDPVQGIIQLSFLIYISFKNKIMWTVKFIKRTHS